MFGKEDMTISTLTVPASIADVVCEGRTTTFGPMGTGNAHFVSSLTPRMANFVGVRREVATVIAAQFYYVATGKTATATKRSNPR